MRIAHVTSGLCRNSAGLGAAVAAISAGTEALGNEVRVFGLSSREWREGDDTAWAGAPASVFEPASWSGPLAYASGLLKGLIDFSPDVVHLHGLWTYPALAVYRWHVLTGRPYVVSAHGMLMPASLSYNSTRKKLARWLFMDKVVKSATVLHATSGDEADAYGALGFKNPVRQVRLGISSTPIPEVSADPFRRRALLLGRLHHQKGIDWLVEAWLSTEADFPDWDLSIVGPQDVDYAEQIERLMQRSMGRRISFLPPLYGDEKNFYIAGSELFLMPSRSENFGLAAAESLMLGVPVIATKGTPWSGLVEANAGWWIDEGPKPLAAALREALALPRDELRLKGINGRRWMEASFSWSATSGDLIDVYRGMLAGY